MSSIFLKGMDVSFLDEIEQAGGRFYEAGEPRDCLEILKRNGVNSIRLRIWNDPPGGYCNLERTIQMAKRIKALGLHFLLDFHYSDQWADPANQKKPKAWAELSFEELKATVRAYTEEVLVALKNEDALPDMVQVGNEITPGMLWDEGKVAGEEYDTDQQWLQFAELVQAGIAGVKAVGQDINLMIHIDRGGDNAASRKFFDRFEALGVSFDTIGLSFYPWWHGTLEDLRLNLEDLAQRYEQEIVVVETAYPWTLEAEGEKVFIVKEEEQLHHGYSATVEGQAAYLRDFLQVIQQAPGGKGAGFHYWEPCWIPSKQEWSVGHPNNWSNLTLFDFEGQVLNSIRALNT